MVASVTQDSLQFVILVFIILHFVLLKHLSVLRTLDCLFSRDYFSLNEYMDGTSRSDLHRTLASRTLFHPE